MNQDIDVNTTSEMCSEDSYAKGNYYDTNNTIKESLQTPGQHTQFVPNMSSLVIREKKVLKNNNQTLSPSLNTSNDSSFSVDTTKTGVAKLKINHNYNLNVTSSPPYSTNTTFKSMDLEANDIRTKNYQELSNSISDLFSNLLKHLERQKNKEYFFENQTNDLNNKNPIDYPVPPFPSGYLNNQTTIKIAANLKNSKTSNQDSGFNQSFYNTSNMPLDNTTSNRLFKEKMYATEISNIKSQNGVVGYNDQDDGHIDESLLERYLNNEQTVAYKHSKIESILMNSFNENNMIVDDYSIIEYIINQEGISKRTFSQLIREKFDYIEWPDELLDKLFKIIENADSNDYNLNTNYLKIEPDQRMVKLNKDVLNEKNLTKFIMESKEAPGSPLIAKHDVAQSPANSSSSRSYRRIKDIKNSINSKKILVSQNNLDTDEVVYENLLKKNLFNSFVKRRERKGSLPEINTSHLIGSDEIGTENFNNDNEEDEDDNDGGFVENLIDNHQHIPLLHSVALNNQQETKIHNKISNVKRNSRKSAFVLEVFRTSMFRSKSLTDLNGSLVKSDNLNNFSNNYSTQTSFKNSALNVNNNGYSVSNGSNRVIFNLSEK